MKKSVLPLIIMGGLLTSNPGVAQEIKLNNGEKKVEPKEMVVDSTSKTLADIIVQPDSTCLGQADSTSKILVDTIFLPDSIGLEQLDLLDEIELRKVLPKDVKNVIVQHKGEISGNLDRLSVGEQKDLIMQYLEEDPEIHEVLSKMLCRNDVRQALKSGDSEKISTIFKSYFGVDDQVSQLLLVGGISTGIVLGYILVKLMELIFGIKKP